MVNFATVMANTRFRTLWGQGLRVLWVLTPSTLGQHLAAHSRIEIVEGGECTGGQR